MERFRLPFLDKEHVQDKGGVLDIKARDGRGRLYNIEMQVSEESCYTERAVYYLARLFSGQLERGDPYGSLAKTIGISLCDFCLFPDLDDLHSTYRLYDEGHGRLLTDVLELHVIELAKFRSGKPHELRTPFEKWLHVLKFGELYEEGPDLVPEVLRQEEGIEMALDAMRKASASEEVRELIEARMKARRDEATRMESARRQGVEQGREQTRRASILDVALARFGANSQGLETALAEVTALESLERLTRVAATAETAGDLLAAVRREVGI